MRALQISEKPIHVRILFQAPISERHSGLVTEISEIAMRKNKITMSVPSVVLTSLPPMNTTTDEMMVRIPPATIQRAAGFSKVFPICTAIPAAVMARSNK